jgi:hypothetical protein
MSIPERETNMLWVSRSVPIAGSEREHASGGPESGPADHHEIGAGHDRRALPHPLLGELIKRGRHRPLDSGEACLIELLRWLNASWVLVGEAGFEPATPAVRLPAGQRAIAPGARERSHPWTGRSSPYCRTSPSTRARCCTGRTAVHVCTCRMISCDRWPERGSRRGRGLCRPAGPGMACGRCRRHSPGPPASGCTWPR